MTHKLSELLFRVGISPLPRAKVLVYFLTMKEETTTSREIERKVDLRQPEVSLALSAFIEKKWITILPTKEQAGKGRPEKRYLLAVTPDIIFKAIATTVEKENQERNKLLSELAMAMTPVKQSVPGESIPKVIQQNLMK